MNRMTLKSTINNINLVERLIDDITSEHSINPDIYGKLLLAVVEGVNNAIVHGNKLDPAKDVTLDYMVTGKEITFIISDQGCGFNYTNLPDPTLPENLERTHGRGVFLMNHLADKVEFNDSGNQVMLSFQLS